MYFEVLTKLTIGSYIMPPVNMHALKLSY